MRFNFVCLLFLVVFTDLPASGADSLLLLFPSATQGTVPWRKQYESPTLSVASDAGLHGDKGIAWRAIPGRVNWGAEFPFSKSYWFTYSFRLDTCQVNIGDTLFADFMTLNFSKSERFFNFLTFYLRQGAGGPAARMGFQMQVSRDSPSPFDFMSEPLEVGRVYRSEVKLDFFAVDSVSVTWYVDNKEERSVRSFFAYEPALMGVSLFCRTRNDYSRHPCRLSLDDFAVSSERRGAIPPKPEQLRISPDSIRDRQDPLDFLPAYAQTVFLWDKIESRYQGEYFNAAEWRIASESGHGFPLYQRIGEDVADCKSLVVPFPLDSGVYFVRTRLRNNFNVWGDWSADYRFQINKKRPQPAHIRRAYFTAPASESVLDTIQAGEWYILHLDFNKESDWRDLGYLLVYLNDSSYTGGNPSNKGGLFLKKSSYAVNYSFNGREGGFFERYQDDSQASRLLSQGTEGLYLDVRSPDLFFDPGKGEFRVKMKLLSEANPGRWHMTALIRSSYKQNIAGNLTIDVENCSNIYESVFQVLPSSTGISRAWLFSLLLIPAVFGVYRRFRVYPDEKEIHVTEKIQDEVFLRITEYLEEHLREKLLVKEICQKLKIGKNEFFEIFQRQGEKYAAYVNRLRIEKAVKLMKTTEMNVSEITFETGFESPEYFSKIFKNQMGVTPSKFKKTLPPVSDKLSS